MSTTRREFFLTSASAAAAAAAASPSQLDGAAIAGRHKIVRTLPTPDFFEGMLLGNGDIGVCVTVRPDALGLHIGKSDSWDIRVSEDHAKDVLTFAELLKLWERAGQEAKRLGKPDMLFLEEEIPFFREYTEKVTASYAKSWPRPWPCGIVWVHWDAPRFRVVRQELDPANGHFSLELNEAGRAIHLHCFVNTATGHVCLWSDEPASFSSVAYYPNLDPEARLPNPEVQSAKQPSAAEFTCVQRFPATAPTAQVPDPPPSAKDSSFVLHGVIRGDWQGEGAASDQHVSFVGRKPQALRIDLALFTPRDHAAPREYAIEQAPRLAALPPQQIQRESDEYWRSFWSRSAVELQDQELERLWVHNQYWLACCLREGKVAPGLFGNWTSGKIGTAWHGDYHMNYNTQQVFWGVFSSNHAEQHFPYIEVVESILPMSRAYAKEKFGLPGAYFPHSAYPVPSQVVPYPAPPWGYEFCETPWVVQSLWWHYLYTLDESILRRVYPLLKDAADFTVAYVKRGADGKFHFLPTVSPENWGCTVDYRLNQDCIMDLALTQFLLDAVIRASEKLGVDQDQRRRWTEVHRSLAPYPRASGPDGEVWVDIVNAPAGWVYNVPVTMAPVFPGEQVGIGVGEEHLEIARRTTATVRLEGGNDVVYQPMIRARLGMLDFEWFKNEVRYCQVPNGIVQDRVRRIGGRYQDSTGFDYMMRMGVWTENLSLPAVLNECLLQSYTGVLRVFPNAKGLGPARFRDLRAAGAFLVSAAWDGASVSSLELLAEKGGKVKLADPWGNGGVKVTEIPANREVSPRIEHEIIEFDTGAGKRYRIGPPG